MKLASGAWRIKQMSYSAADDRADNAENDCPRDRQMRMHQGLGHTTHQEADKDIPNEMKHDFVVTSAIYKFNP